jgi:hypothetical protein
MFTSPLEVRGRDVASVMVESAIAGEIEEEANWLCCSNDAGKFSTGVTELPIEVGVTETAAGDPTKLA